jgi:hypothetical protein
MRCFVALSLAVVLAPVACGAPPEPAQTPVTEDAAPHGIADEPRPPEAAPAPSSEPTSMAATAGEPAPDAADTASAETTTAASSPDAAAQVPASEPAKPPGNTVAETRTMTVIRDVVLKNRQKVRDCYEAALRRTPGLRGTLTLHFILDPKGRVRHAELNQERSTLKDPSLAGCAIDALKRLSFPPSSRGFESEVNYPFDFKP